MKCDKKFANVILMGCAFTLIFTAFVTMANIQQTVIKSIIKEDEHFTGDGFISLAIVYTSFGISTWIGPSFIALHGPKSSMIWGGSFYSLFIASFFLQQTWALYTCSILLGVGSALLWTGQGNYLTLNSNSGNISRNSGVFLALFQSSSLFGNLFVYFLFLGREQIDLNTRTTLYTGFLIVGTAGIALLFFLPQMKDSPTHENERQNEELENHTVSKTRSLLNAFKSSVRLFFTKEMGLFSVTFLYTGLLLAFISGVYSPCIGFTLQFEDSKSLVGLSGIFIGCGEIAGSAIFGILGSLTKRYGRNPIILVGFLSQAVGFVIIFVNLPNNAPFGDTHDVALIKSSSFLAISSSFLISFGDGCFNTQVCSILGSLYAKNSAPAFALNKFVVGLACAVGFFYSPYVGLYGQLATLGVMLLCGTACFLLIERQSARDESRNQNNTNALLEKPSREA